jgi:hypothetical protein
MTMLCGIDDKFEDSSVGIATGFDSRQGQDIFLFTVVSRLELGSIQPPIQWVKKKVKLSL